MPDFVRILPAEITGLIFSFVDHKALVNCERVSQAWRNAALDNHLWRQVFQKEHGPWQAAPGKDWKAMFAVNKDLRNKWKRAEMTYKYMDGHSDSVYCVQFDDVKAITGSRDRSLRVWDITTGECLQTIEAASGTAFHPLDSNTSIPPNLRHDGSILCLQYDPEILITGSSDGSCIVWSLPTFTTIARLSFHSAGVLDLCFDHSHIITCSRDMTVCVWDRSTFKLLRQLRGHTGPVNAIALRENRIVSASGDSLVKMWDLESGECIRDFKGHQRGLACVQFSEDMATIVSGGNDMDIRVWDAHTGECKNVLEGHRNLVRTLHLDARNRRIVSGSYDATVKVWNLDTGKLALDIKHFHSTWVLAVKSDHKRLISTSQDKLGLVIDFSEGVKGLEMLDEE
ncbi:WD40 repeat-like protein [Ascodesmis nigricans]|uniref:WD40 repeat-like protein n=1 Tax=Ascodesmis nigricans TaxID=341454 RepID=A0A4S2MPR8_9PEZI|nr:WD40 repeat-like protein [Ascodesmis nigricans]